MPRVYDANRGTDGPVGTHGEVLVIALTISVTASGSARNPPRPEDQKNSDSPSDYDLRFQRT